MYILSAVGGGAAGQYGILGTSLNRGREYSTWMKRK